MTKSLYITMKSSLESKKKLLQNILDNLTEKDYVQIHNIIDNYTGEAITRIRIDIEKNGNMRF